MVYQVAKVHLCKKTDGAKNICSTREQFQPRKKCTVPAETSRKRLASGTVGSTPLVLVFTTGDGLPTPILPNQIHYFTKFRLVRRGILNLKREWMEAVIIDITGERNMVP
jgi:hypothetical protein